MHTEPSLAFEASGAPPLTLPRELWAKLSSEHQAACRNADKLLGLFDAGRTLGMRDLFSLSELGAEQALSGLRILQGMDLVSIESTEAGPLVKLIAVPEEHVRVVGPDGQVRWLFVSRPLEAPELDPATLN